MAWKSFYKYVLRPWTTNFAELTPQKKRYAIGNNMPFINKTIKKAFRKRSRLRNIYLKNRSDNNKREYNKPRNYCVSLLR